MISIDSHAMWCEKTGSVITQHPYPKSVNAAKMGTMKSSMTIGKMRPPLLGRFFCWLMTFFFLINQEIPHVKMGIGDRCIGNL